MAAQWYCLIGQQQYGPFTGEQIRQLVQQGKLLREHGVRTETDSQWTAAGDLPGLFPSAPVPQAAPVPMAVPLADAASVSPAAPGQPAAPSVTVKSKKKRAAPTVALPPAAPAAAAPTALPTATPVAPPEALVPMATPVVAAPVAKAARSAPPAAVPRAAAPVARAVASAAAVAPAAAAPPPSGPPPARPVAVARPLPVHPVPAATPADPARPATAEGGGSRRGRGSRQKTQLLVGSLAAALLLLIVVAVVVLNRGPGPKKSGASPGGGAAAAKSGDPEVEAGAVAAAQAEPAEIADPVQPLAAAAQVPPAAERGKASSLPPVSRWLDATRQKGGIRDVVRLGVGSVWLESPEGRPAILHVEVEIGNLLKEESLEFTGWRPDDQPQPEMRAAMEDDARTVLAPAAAPSPAGRRAARRRIAPGQSEREQLSFVLPNRDARRLRLALPYAAVGRTGCLGFELPSQMIQDQPPGAEPPAARKSGQAPAESPPPAATEPGSADGEPETIGPLREDIERSEPSAAAMNEPAEPAAGESPQQEKEPEQIPDIRKLIEQDEQKRNPQPEAPPAEPAAEPKPE